MLHWNTVNHRLTDTLDKLMFADQFTEFRLVGGTSLSLQLGHRMSDDIDLFTDAPYGTINFDKIESYLLKTFPFVSGDMGGTTGMGKSFLVGEHVEDYVKLDIFYANDPFFQPLLELDHVRMATIEEIIAMKLEIVKEGGRKKDFWDLHELLNHYSIDQMIGFSAARFEWTHEEERIRAGLNNFLIADKQPDPKCLRGKEWGFIKQDFVELMDRGRPGPGFTR